MPVSRILLVLASTLILSACASNRAPAPVVPAPEPIASAPLPGVVVPVPVLPPVAEVKPLPRPVVQVSEAQGRVLLDALLPRGIGQRSGWRDDILSAFTAQKIPYTAQNFCAALAVIEQESSWQADPTVPGLPAMVWGAIGERAARYHVPLALAKTAFLKASPDGRSYKERIDSLRTEKEVSELFDHMAADAQRYGLPVGMKNPIRTGGPMQVSVAFAESQVEAWPYPYVRRGAIRSEVFSRKGGLYFGIANLLQYPAPYSEMKYRFADFNAGRYSSRNAAFQSALALLSGQALTLDGDLLNYRAGGGASESAQVLASLAGRLGLSQEAIQRDLKLEKLSGFGQSPLYRKVFELAGREKGRALPREIMPQIDLKSPKISRKLTTEWFAGRVNWRYQTCLARTPG
ncbi:DUF1615 domain-containing protein [Craterilacuibacter sp.]|uniref:DUF1615 domain-containing protein n=1 Tax=Craterilacuibacter sp. TaxID=2870909 RepID=UPI003F3BF8A2